MEPKISQRAINTPSSAIRKLVPFADQAKKKGIKIFHLNIGQPDLPTPSKVLHKIQNFKLKTLEYAPSSGLIEAVEAWRKFYLHKNISLQHEDIIVTSGGSEALLFSFLAVADVKDELIVFEPFYTSYAILASMGGIVLKAVPTKAEEGYHLPERKIIEKVISKKTKGIVLCNPNNPTGTMYTAKEVTMLAEIALKYKLFIISDETYQELVFDNKKVLPFFSFKKLHSQLIITDSVSKRFNSCGARIGCVASKNRELMQAMLRFAQGRLSVATVEQLSLVPLIENHMQYVEKIKSQYQKRRNTVVAGLHKIPGVSFVVPEGAFYIMPKIPVKDSDDFATFLLNNFSDSNETVMVAPGSGFYMSKNAGKDQIRIAYVLEENKLKRAMEILKIALDKYKQQK